MSVGAGESGDVAVHWAGLADAIGQLDRANQDFSALINNYELTVCLAPAGFGDFGVAGAWSDFDVAWDRELQQTAEALTELIQDVQTASGGLRITDDISARSLRADAPR